MNDIMKKLCNVFILLLMSVVFLQCKSNESQVNKSRKIKGAFTPTLIVRHSLTEHQFEGKDSLGLVSIEITGGNLTVPQWAFAIVPTLEQVKLAPSVKILDDNAFFSCKKLKKINLNNVESIGENCFKFTALERVELKRTRTIKDFAFSNCPKLIDVEFADCLESIGEFGFSGDTAIVACHVPSGVIGASAFMGCSSLKQISFGKVSSIGNAAFLDCISLTSVVIPSTMKEIGSEAFIGCVNLKEVIVNSPNTKIAEDAFAKNVIITLKKFDIQ